MSTTNVFTIVAFTGGTLLGITGVLGMLVFSGASKHGAWLPWRDWWRYLFTFGPVRVRRWQLLGMGWFLGCAALSLVFIFGVMVLGRAVLGPT
ncbi:hypothetical protein LZ198_05835 [Myxococcus sp. K15C18031901]|uniref:hypothetical protein n=1 Tax=Myxococcus dinghuensis TaxID=2906761 RepID=UPI0020A81DAA|nr:hypothetical protein [Myxococcus dinghuensis]MCP3098398.1 hypothetical protein [Myxococcus dinghuensis]